MKLEYAIVDIETTGGNARGSRMTEIAIRIHNGKEVIDSFESLINPEKDIPLAIFALTGIDNEMVRYAPVFGDIAKRVYDMLEGRIFVAHNVNFDYSFVKHQLAECGLKWTAKKLCTVRMARKIKPGHRSYSLGYLCDDLEIPITNRHRAGGDCDATAILFKRLLEWDEDGVIAEMVKKSSKDQRLPPNLPADQFEALPERTGVYYFHDKKGKVIYVGKALNIKKRVGQHFSGHNINPQRQNFLREIHAVSAEICSTELMALLLECAEIKRLWPVHNRALKKYEPKFGVFVYEDMAGYKRLAVGKISKMHTCCMMVNREYDAVKLLSGLVDRYGIDTRLCSFTNTKLSRQDIAQTAIATHLPPVAEHNDTVESALEELQGCRPTFALFDKGRDGNEKSCVFIEKGNFYGMGYIDNGSQLSDIHDVRDNLTRYAGNHYMAQLIINYAEKYPRKVMKLG
ncbi:exonuclease domain-containing protein [Sphingobacterium yanglingense]|uniref:DNA polymerase-3 subunit epsilon n=1 Tax=Sphingobacterium yanglingense TaxID=1437280 RepID=A0A4R6WHT9_9SPHI|nr:exonuclease domain-containing protein [Sphingobacterium yanglingense]TDQ79773.1 DNA polymerase-3 subunit epsilon [Sphingobacterium yanglingense]